MLHTIQNPNGTWKWTLATRFSACLGELETRFGPRDPSWCFCGVEVIPDGPPTLFYPDGGNKHVVIRLNSRCVDDVVQTIFQLSHECVHLMAPTGRKDANNLEEGVASWFSQDYTRRTTGTHMWYSEKNYMDAQHAVESLLKQHPNCIRQIRNRQPCLSRVDTALLAELFPDHERSNLEFLAAPFPY